MVKVDGLDLDVRIESVLVEQNRTSSIVSHVEPVREELVVNILNRFLQSDDMPLPCNSSFNGVPVVGAKSFFVQSIGWARRCRNRFF